MLDESTIELSDPPSLICDGFLEEDRVNQKSMALLETNIAHDRVHCIHDALLSILEGPVETIIAFLLFLALSFEREPPVMDAVYPSIV